MESNALIQCIEIRQTDQGKKISKKAITSALNFACGSYIKTLELTATFASIFVVVSASTSMLDSVPL